jgi:hypothetical protein
VRNSKTDIRLKRRSQNIIKKAALELSVKESSILELYEKIVHY